MTWIHFVVLVWCCHCCPFNSPSSLSSLTVGAVRLRENSNVLVPNNDVNVKAKIKQALNGDVDVDELKSVGINKIIESVKNPKSEKLIVDQLERGARSGNENQQPVMAASAMNFTTENSTWSYTTPTTVGFNENVTTTPENFTTPEWIMTTQQTNESTTMSFNFTSDVPTTWTTPSDINATTTYNETSTTPAYYESTVSNETTPESTSTTHTPQTNSILTNECVLSDQSDIKPKWIDTDGKLIEDAIKAEDGSVEILDFSRNFQTQLDYDKFMRTFVQINNLLHVKYLSMAFNGLTELPNRILNLWNTTLSHLSLAGNNFAVTLENSIGFDHFPSLRHLDFRRCRLQNIKKHYFQHLTALTYLDVSNNEIIEIFPDAFPPSLVHLDLSRNTDPSLIQGLTIRDKVFTNNSMLISIDFSHTRIKIEDKSALALRQMPASLRFVSFCYVDLPNFEGNLLLNSNKIEMLDLSGNSRFNFTSEKFEFIQNSLEVLTVRSSNIRELNWLENMSNLRSLNLSDNNINSLAKENFRHMEKLVELNLARNSIGNWYEQLFANNQQLDVLNLRDNKLTRLTNDMREDLSGVKFLALGKNSDFECSCEIEAFLHKLFRDTRAANFTAMQQIDTEFHIVDDTEHLSSAQPTRIFLASRSSNPRYDVIQRTLQKYYKMAEASVEALKIREVKSSSGGLVMRKSATANSDNSYDKTLLFDYREDADDYQCINATAKERRPIIELDLCSSEQQSERSDENATPKRISTLTIVSVSFTSVIIVSVLSIVVYWKWWYVKYFFVLCKNSAILTFMDDSPESDAIIAKKRTSRASIDAYIYDVFVSYSEQNRNWVLSEFIPNVEKRESINICLHERDFTVGSGILENIISCMDQSRCLLLLISSDFLQSQWCLFEMNLAQHRLLETRREKLILVLLEDIPEKRQPRTLRYLMRTKTYIKWPQNGGKDEKMLFWRRLKKAIISTRWELESYGSAV